MKLKVEGDSIRLIPEGEAEEALLLRWQAMKAHPQFLPSRMRLKDGDNTLHIIFRGGAEEKPEEEK